MDACSCPCASSPDDAPRLHRNQRTPTIMTNTPRDLREANEAVTSGAERQGSVAETGGETLRLPDGAVPVLPIRNTVLFPGIVIPLGVARPRSLAAIQYAARNKSMLGVILQRDAEAADPGA